MDVDVELPIVQQQQSQAGPSGQQQVEAAVVVQEEAGPSTSGRVRPKRQRQPEIAEEIELPVIEEIDLNAPPRKRTRRAKSARRMNVPDFEMPPVQVAAGGVRMKNRNVFSVAHHSVTGRVYGVCTLLCADTEEKWARRNQFSVSFVGKASILLNFYLSRK